MILMAFDENHETRVNTFMKLPGLGEVRLIRFPGKCPEDGGRLREEVIHAGCDVVDHSVELERLRKRDGRWEFVKQRKYMDGTFESIDEEFVKQREYMDGRFESIDKRFESIDKRFESMGARLTRLEAMTFNSKAQRAWQEIRQKGNAMEDRKKGNAMEDSGRRRVASGT